MNPLLTTKQETFRAGTDKLEFFRERLLKMNNGALMFCTRGEENIILYPIRTLRCFQVPLFH